MLSPYMVLFPNVPTSHCQPRAITSFSHISRVSIIAIAIVIMCHGIQLLKPVLHKESIGKVDSEGLITTSLQGKYAPYVT
jgi:hypothetical protein